MYLPRASHCIPVSLVLSLHALSLAGAQPYSLSAPDAVILNRVFEVSVVGAEPDADVQWACDGKQLRLESSNGPKAVIRAASLGQGGAGTVTALYRDWRESARVRVVTYNDYYRELGIQPPAPAKQQLGEELLKKAEAKLNSGDTLSLWSDVFGDMLHKGLAMTDLMAYKAEWVRLKAAELKAQGVPAAQTEVNAQSLWTAD